MEEEGQRETKGRTMGHQTLTAEDNDKIRDQHENEAEK